MILVLVVAALVLPVTDFVRRGSMRRLALRNISRRKGEALLIVAGSLLGTAIITASFVVSDTFNSSIRDTARTQLGPIDERVTVAGRAETHGTEAYLRSSRLHDVDGLLSVEWTDVAVASVRPNRLAEPSQRMAEYDFARARGFGGDAASTGFEDAGPTPAGRDAVLNTELARKIGVVAGDRVDVFAYGRKARLRVRQVVPRLGLAGSGGLFVASGTIDRLATATGAAQAERPHNEVLVSNRGGVYSGVAVTDFVSRQLTVRVPALRVETTKRDVLTDARSRADAIGQLFTGIGMFSVLAGVLLLVNLFVMMGEERKAELGMLRAVGLRRNHLMRAFGLEGACYGIVAALLGAVTGVGVGAAIVVVTRGIFRGDASGNVTLRFAVTRSSVLTGGCIGLLISLATVYATSARISRLNVIAAIRDLPDAMRSHRWRPANVLGIAGSALGAVLLLVGLVASVPVLTIAGPSLACFAAMSLTSRVAPRAAIPVLASVALIWPVLAFTVAPDAMRGASIPVFVLQGVILVAAAVTILSRADGAWGRFSYLVGRSGTGIAATAGLPMRLGLAYPLARRFRTSLLLGMYALVMFTLTFLAVFAGIFASQEHAFLRDTRAGTDIVVDSNPANPASAATLRSQADVDDAAVLLRAGPEVTTRVQPTPTRWALTGFDAAFLRHGFPSLASHLPRFADARATWQAILHDPSLVAASDAFLRRGGGPGGPRIRVGDTINARNPLTGVTQTFVVAGLVDRDFVFNGVLASTPAVRQVMGPGGALPTRAYVTVRPGADHAKVAARLQGRLLANGATARPFTEVVHDQTSQQIGFFRLMQGYLGLGLLIGIAGLGVVMVRAVRERRRQIGMLRAMGFTSSVVRRAFLVEAGFIAAQGIAVGVVLGTITAYQVLTNSSTFGDQSLPFDVPVLALGTVCAIPLFASLGAALLPANRASRIRPAAALRVAD
jgi:putative ABC transport system permease protein